MPANREKQGGRTANKTSFKPGQSGNPNGRPKDTDVVRKAREGMGKMVPDVINGMREALADPDTKLADKIKIWDIILDRSLGKAVQPIQADVFESDEPVTLGEMLTMAREVVANAGSGGDEVP